MLQFGSYCCLLFFVSFLLVYSITPILFIPISRTLENISSFCIILFLIFNSILNYETINCTITDWAIQLCIHKKMHHQQCRYCEKTTIHILFLNLSFRLFYLLLEPPGVSHFRSCQCSKRTVAMGATMRGKLIFVAHNHFV